MLWLNDGKGRFSIATLRMPSSFQVCRGLILVDVDIGGRFEQWIRTVP